MKKCSRCREFLELSRFHKNASAHDGLQANCKKCSSAIQRLKRYGLDPQEFKNLLEGQSYQCCICDEGLDLNSKSYAIDHNHATGKVRGVLCVNCNHGLGKLKDSPEIIMKAHAYLMERGHYG